MAIEFPILWGKNKDGKDGFVVSHVKQIYYDWKSKKMLSDKLDDMDEIITANADAIAERLVTNDALATALANYVTKSMMSGQQVNDANMVPTSALAYAMQQAITKNAGDISTLNGKNALVYQGDINGDYGANFDDVSESGFYSYHGSPVNCPPGYGYGIVLVITIMNGYSVQMSFSALISITVRSRPNNKTAWSNWIVYSAQ